MSPDVAAQIRVELLHGWRRISVTHAENASVEPYTLGQFPAKDLGLTITELGRQRLPLC